MLRLKLLRLGVPGYMISWIWASLRHRRAAVEVNGTRSRERPFRAGLPQGSVLAPTLYTLWSADLITALKTVPDTDIFMYADDTERSHHRGGSSQSPASSRRHHSLGLPMEKCGGRMRQGRPVLVSGRLQTGLERRVPETLPPDRILSGGRRLPDAGAEHSLHTRRV